MDREWVLVPKEPTEEMVKAAWDDSGNVSRFGQKQGIVNRYRKMIAARPKCTQDAPTETSGEKIMTTESNNWPDPALPGYPLEYEKEQSHWVIGKNSKHTFVIDWKKQEYSDGSVDYVWGYGDNPDHEDIDTDDFAKDYSYIATARPEDAILRQRLEKFIVTWENSGMHHSAEWMRAFLSRVDDDFEKHQEKSRLMMNDTNGPMKLGIGIRARSAQNKDNTNGSNQPKGLVHRAVGMTCKKLLQVHKKMGRLPVS